MWPITVDASVTIRIKLISYSYINKGNQKETKNLKLLKTAQCMAGTEETFLCCTGERLFSRFLCYQRCKKLEAYCKIE